jgi:hypothetical protein
VPRFGHRKTSPPDLRPTQSRKSHQTRNGATRCGFQVGNDAPEVCADHSVVTLQRGLLLTDLIPDNVQCHPLIYDSYDEQQDKNPCAGENRDVGEKLGEEMTETNLPGFNADERTRLMKIVAPLLSLLLPRGVTLFAFEILPLPAKDTLRLDRELPGQGI